MMLQGSTTDLIVRISIRILFFFYNFIFQGLNFYHNFTATQLLSMVNLYVQHS